MRLLLAFCFAAGIGLVWFGLLYELPLRAGLPPMRRLLEAAGVRVDPRAFVLGCVVLGVLAGLVASALVDVPVLALAAGCAGGWAPVAWARSRRERRRRERERAWPAAVAQLADALEAG